MVTETKKQPFAAKAKKDSKPKKTGKAKLNRVNLLPQRRYLLEKQERIRNYLSNPFLFLEVPGGFEPP